MTLVKINIFHVSSQANYDDRVTFFAPGNREGADGALISTAPVSVPLIKGVGEVDLVPGEVMVRVECRGIADSRTKRGVVPAVGPTTLLNVLQLGGSIL